eukprot:3584879-Pyramimonas_sp.AAC.2
MTRRTRAITAMTMTMTTTTTKQIAVICDNILSFFVSSSRDATWSHGHIAWTSRGPSWVFGFGSVQGWEGLSGPSRAAS